jgi:para-nitrobenzyl esterase
MRKFFLIQLPALILAMPVFAQSNGNSSAAVSVIAVNQVKTANGIVEGNSEKAGILSFKGIPFAAPPVGDLRWKEPQAVKNWTGVRQTKKFGPNPMQYAVYGDMNFRSDGMSEDCLYLNVWSPVRKDKKLLPVLVYFYGGGFVAGDGSEARYDGESMARKGIVALTVNYRLGVFGFLAHPELTKESPHHASGNYALLDQAAALRWVQQNIAAFGGDPKKVTIAGESAGSIAVSGLMASPLSKNLIAGAIGESGSLLGALSAVPLSAGEQTGQEFAMSLEANSLAGLRAIRADKILEASRKFNPFRFSMTIDGYFFPKSPYAIYEAGEQAQVPLLVGWNSEEMNYRAVLGNEKPTREGFTKAVQKLYGDRSEQALKNYHAETDEEVEQVATDLASDRFIAFSTWKWAELQGRTGGKPVYRYYFSKPRPATTASSNMPFAKGAVHSAEIEYAMGNLVSNKVYAWTEDDYKVSRTMQEYFANFIKKANPYGAGLPAWPPINADKNIPVMHIDVNARVEPDAHRGRYLFMDEGVSK